MKNIKSATFFEIYDLVETGNSGSRMVIFEKHNIKIKMMTVLITGFKERVNNGFNNMLDCEYVFETVYKKHIEDEKHKVG